MLISGDIDNSVRRLEVRRSHRRLMPLLDVMGDVIVARIVAA